MADEVILSNLSDDSDSKKFIMDTLMPKVFHDVPLNVLNVGEYSIINEYMSQGMEQQAFTSAFYFNESFITKAALPDSIYSEAAIFNIGYSYATPSSCYFLLELHIDDIKRNAVLNNDTKVYEFILDKNTRFNLPNGNIYSLDYDILIQYMNPDTPTWNVQYIHTDEMNSVAKNKRQYILYRVTNTWLCLFVTAGEYIRESHTIVNNMANGIPNSDVTITCNDHIAGFDIKFTDADGTEKWIPHDHILPIHASINDQQPYIHYIMDNPQTIRFMFQLGGNRYWIAPMNSSFEVIVYRCHGRSANFDAYNNDEQPNVITSSTRYANNGNVRKALYVISGSVHGTDIGNVESVRRDTIEAYNTAMDISTDHDIDEWFKTFYFKNVLFPYFFKRRDDPWGRIWSGFVALKDSDDTVFRTNTVEGDISYDVLYSNNNNTVDSNEIIIPPGWTWEYIPGSRYQVKPYIRNDNTNIVESAKNVSVVNDGKFIFANPFGIRIQKDPFAIGYFNPWINEYYTTTVITDGDYNHGNDRDQLNDRSKMYHATPLTWNIDRSYMKDYYAMTTYISPTITSWVDDKPLVEYVKKNATPPLFVNNMWTYFSEPLDLYAASIPLLKRKESDGYIGFDPKNTYLCAKRSSQLDDGSWTLSSLWIEDDTDAANPFTVSIPITGNVDYLYGTDDVWGVNGIAEGVAFSGSTDISLRATDRVPLEDIPIVFAREGTQQYYTMRSKAGDDEHTITIISISTEVAYRTTSRKYNETLLWRLGNEDSPVTINLTYSDGETLFTDVPVQIVNAENVFIPYEPTAESPVDGKYVFNLEEGVTTNGILIYADMKSAPTDQAFDHYRVKFYDIDDNTALFYIKSKLLPLKKNNMRVILQAYTNGDYVGWVEMQPVQLEEDGSYKFDVSMYPLNELIDIDSRIQIASIDNGGGSWIPTVRGSAITIDSMNPTFVVSILVRSEDIQFKPYNDTEHADIDEEFYGFRIVDQYTIDDISLVQELKEMRSVVTFGETTQPTPEQVTAYKTMCGVLEKNDTHDRPEENYDLYEVIKYLDKKRQGLEPEETIGVFSRGCYNSYVIINKAIESLNGNPEAPFDLTKLIGVIYQLSNVHSDAEIIPICSSAYSTEMTWNDVYALFDGYYLQYVNDMFAGYNVDGNVSIQLMPVTSLELMVSDRFDSFVAAFTDVHRKVSPVIFERLDGNDYLDCKLLATYGLPHTYCADINKDLPPVSDAAFWPNLDIQIEFDIKLFNDGLKSNTITDLKSIIKAYFNRITTIHTPVEEVSMDHNIYISQLIQQMESHDNVAYLKFKGWYTKSSVNERMGPDVQAIVQKWPAISKMPQGELEKYVPEMFVLDDNNIILNIL